MDGACRKSSHAINTSCIREELPRPLGVGGWGGGGALGHGMREGGARPCGRAQGRKHSIDQQCALAAPKPRSHAVPQQRCHNRPQRINAAARHAASDPRSHSIATAQQRYHEAASPIFARQAATWPRHAIRGAIWRRVLPIRSAIFCRSNLVLPEACRSRACRPLHLANNGGHCQRVRDPRARRGPSVCAPRAVGAPR